MGPVARLQLGRDKTRVVEIPATCAGAVVSQEDVIARKACGGASARPSSRIMHASLENRGGRSSMPMGEGVVQAMHSRSPPCSPGEPHFGAGRAGDSAGAAHTLSSLAAAAPKGEPRVTRHAGGPGGQPPVLSVWPPRQNATERGGFTMWGAASGLELLQAAAVPAAGCSSCQLACPDTSFHAHRYEPLQSLAPCNRATRPAPGSHAARPPASCPPRSSPLATPRTAA